MKLRCHDQLRAPFVTWHFPGSPLKCKRVKPACRGAFGPSVASILGVICRNRYGALKRRDLLGMKYMRVTFFLAVVLLASASLLAQSQPPYVPPVAMSAFASSPDTDSDCVLTIN